MVFVGGKLSLKGDKKKSRKKKSKSKHDKKKSSRDDEAAAAAATANDSNGSDVDEDEMTEAERKAQKYKQQAEKKDLEKVAKQSHRDRVEEYSQKLSQLTELNDIPRMSATCMWADAICVGVLGWKRQWDIFSVHRVLTAWLMLFCCFVHMLSFTTRTNTLVTCSLSPQNHCVTGQCRRQRIREKVHGSLVGEENHWSWSQQRRRHQIVRSSTYVAVPVHIM